MPDCKHSPAPFLIIAALTSVTLAGTLCRASVSAQPLQAGVTQTAVIGPVAPPLQAGSTFDERNLPPLHTRTGWYEIPVWAAGYWHRETQTDKIGMFREVTHESRRDRLRGDQIDRSGRIWQAHDEPNLVNVDTGSTIDYIVDRSTEPVSITEQVMVIHYIASDVIVDKSSRRIVKSSQRDETQRIQRGPNSTLLCTSELIRFDQNGNRQDKITGTWTETLIRQFQPLDFSKGRNYFQEFCQFLHSVGQDANIPLRAFPTGQAPQQQNQAPPQDQIQPQNQMQPQQ